MDRLVEIGTTEGVYIDGDIRIVGVEIGPGRERGHQWGVMWVGEGSMAVVWGGTVNHWGMQNVVVGIGSND